MENEVLALCDRHKIGTKRQCEALLYPLAKLYHATPRIIDIDRPWWLRILPLCLARWLPQALLSPFMHPHKKIILVIAAGNAALRYASIFNRLCPTVVILNPHCPSHYFKLILPHDHDNMPHAPNIIPTCGAMNDFSSDMLISTTDTQRLVVLLGGNTRFYTYTDDDYRDIAGYILEKFHNNPCLDVFITPSRRTSADGLQIIRLHLKGIHCTIWDGKGDNSYPHILSHASEILVTSDSISMISEACYFGKPVEIWNVPFQHPRFHRFIHTLITHQHAVYAKSPWPKMFIPLRERDRVIPLIIQHLDVDMCG
jgi:mitochondrial fission protein ELM1